MLGRPQWGDYISEALEADVPTIHVTSEKNSADIVRYIGNSIRKSSTLKRVSAKLRDEIVEKLSTGAQGMFMWVDLMLQVLLKKKSESAIWKSLDEAPKGLKEMLRHVLESFSLDSTEEDAEYLNELLAWTTCTQRPLELGELDAILRLQSQEGEGMLSFEDALRGRFASFFSLTREDGLSTGELQSMPRNVVDSDDEQEDTVHEKRFDDIECVTVFDSNPRTTDVTFCHASIGDFFRDESEGKVSASDGYPAIGVDFNQAKISVLKKCIELFCDDELVNKLQGRSRSVMSYACDNWQAHLLAVDPSTVNITQRREICGLLAKMFRQEAFMSRWDESVDWAFFNEDNVMLIRKWLDDEEVAAYLPSEDQEFIRTTSESTVQTFKPLARYTAKQWLEEEQGLEEEQWQEDERLMRSNHCAVVFAYITLEKGAPLDKSFTGLESAEEIIFIAEWPNLNKTALWHRRLAMALRDKEKYDEALEHFSKALELDSTMWRARGGMAMVHLLKEEYGKAIELDKVTERELQQKLANDPTVVTTETDLHKIQEQMADSYRAMGDEDNAFEQYRNAYRNKANCDYCNRQLLIRMDAKGLHHDIIDLLKALDDLSLTVFILNNKYVGLDCYRMVAEAARKINELDFLIEAYRTAVQFMRIEVEETVAASFLEQSLARLYYEYTQEQEKALRIWNKAIMTRAGSKEDGLLGRIKMKASIRLAQHFFRSALDAGRGSRDAEEHVKNLENLVKKRAQVMASSTFICAEVPAIILGVWYRLTGMQEDANACFRPWIVETIQLLSDDDPDSNKDGLYKLFIVLVAASDDKNSIAILHLQGSYGDHERTESAVDGEDDSTSEDNNGRSQFSCDGLCCRSLPKFDSFYVCRYCFETLFCEDCMQLLKSGAMPINVCSQRHEWLFVPPLRQKVERGKLLIDGTLVDFKDFLNDLKRQWQV